jgi:uncharacterized phage protein (TIGR02218 family)
VLLSIIRVHRGEAEQVPWWSGRVLNCDWRDGQAQLRCENIYTSLRRTGLRRLYQRNCPHVLYDGNSCRLLKGDFATPATVVSSDGRLVTLSGIGAIALGRLAGGFLEWVVSIGRTERRGIRSHGGGGLLELTHQIPDLPDGAAVIVYPGCAHNLEDCDTFFDNAVNYGGWPFIQDKNPMGGSNVF